jgi:hypothetical protein
VSARSFACGLVMLLAATSGCKKLNTNRCETDNDCGNSGTCNPMTNYCVQSDAGTDATGMGGAGGSHAFSCPNPMCKGTAPICDVDAGSCRVCNAAKTTACGSLDAGTPVCVPGDAGAKAGMCVGCLANSDCKTPQAPICDTSTGTCQACTDSAACATKDASHPVCVTTATTTLMKGMCVGCLMDSHCTTPQAPICSVDTGICEGCDAAGATACATKTPTKPVCLKVATGSSAKGTCVVCVSNSDCNSTPNTPICNPSSNTCVACGPDSDCPGGPGVCMTDGHCATDAESIYVQNNVPTCTTTASSSGGTKTQPFCTMEPVAAVLAPGRDLVVVNGTSGVITGGSWTYTNQVGAQLSIVGKQTPTIGSVSAPAFSMQSGTVNIRAVTFSSLSSIGISASGGTLDLDHVTVSSCGGGGILLNNAAFDIENTTVKNNGPSSDLSWGGIKVQSLPATGPTKLNLVTLTGNTPSGMSCAAGAAPMGTGVFASGNGSGDISGTCNITTCTPASGTCGSQP